MPWPGTWGEARQVDCVEAPHRWRGRRTRPASSGARQSCRQPASRHQEALAVSDRAEVRAGLAENPLQPRQRERCRHRVGKPRPPAASRDPGCRRRAMWRRRPSAGSRPARSVRRLGHVPVPPSVAHRWRRLRFPGPTRLGGPPLLVVDCDDAGDEGHNRNGCGGREQASQSAEPFELGSRHSFALLDAGFEECVFELGRLTDMAAAHSSAASSRPPR